jgi:hypothetical protein
MMRTTTLRTFSQRALKGWTFLGGKSCSVQSLKMASFKWASSLGANWMTSRWWWPESLRRQALHRLDLRLHLMMLRLGKTVAPHHDSGRPRPRPIHPQIGGYSWKRPWPRSLSGVCLVLSYFEFVHSEGFQLLAAMRRYHCATLRVIDT